MFKFILSCKLVTSFRFLPLTKIATKTVNKVFWILLFWPKIHKINWSFSFEIIYFLVIITFFIFFCNLFRIAICSALFSHKMSQSKLCHNLTQSNVIYIQNFINLVQTFSLPLPPSPSRFVSPSLCLSPSLSPSLRLSPPPICESWRLRWRWPVSSNCWTVVKCIKYFISSRHHYQR